MMKRTALLLSALALTACTQDSRDALAREQARNAVRPILAERFPGIPLEPATNCVINNASAGEILSLAADSVTGPDAGTVDTVIGIVQRRETIVCLVEEGLPPLLALQAG